MRFIFRKRALEATDNSGLQNAIDWIEKQQTSSQADQTDQTEEAIDKEEEGKLSTLKCEECGKLFSSTERAEYHSFKTKHQNFVETTEVIKKLSKEERIKYLEELRKKSAERKAEKSKIDLEEAKQNEMIRRKAAKESSESKQKLEEIEMQKAAEKRKREKEEDRLAKERIKAQIEADKLERQRKVPNLLFYSLVIPYRFWKRKRHQRCQRM